MSDANFASILDRPAADIKKPPVTPPGSYLGIVESTPPKFDKTPNGTPTVEFQIRLLQPMEDVDQELLSQIDGGINGRKVRASFYLTEDALWRLTNPDENGFLDLLGVAKSTPRQMLAEAPGNQIVVTLRNKPNKAGTDLYAEIAGYARP